MDVKKDAGALHKEIDLIQSCINRMAQNSFLVKGWALTIITVVLAVSKEAVASAHVCLVLLIPLLGFWYLDAFFVRTERMYRKMYEWVLDARSRDDSSYLYDLNPHRFEKGVHSRWRIMWSLTLLVFYGIPLAIVVVALYHMHTQCPAK